MNPRILVALTVLIIGCNPTNRSGDNRLASSDDTTDIMQLKQITMLIDKGWQYFASSSFKDADKLADSILAYSDHADYPNGRAEAFLLSGRISHMQGNQERALELENKALNIFQTTGSQEKEIKAYMAIGETNERLGKYTEAVNAYQEIFQILDKLDNTAAHAEACNDLGVVFFRMGHYAEALKHYLSSLKIYKALGNEEGVASVQNNIGLIYMRNGNPEKAIESFKQVLKVANDLKAGITVAKAHSNLGTLYAHQEKYDEAIAHQNAALNIFKNINDRSGMAEAYSSLGITHFGLQNYPKALSYFQTSAQLARETGNRIFLASALTNSGNVYSSLGDLSKGKKSVHFYEKALNDQLQSIAIADSIGAKETLASAFDAITFTYKGLHNTEKALEYTERLLLLKDSLLNSNVDKQLEELRTQYEVDKAITLLEDKQKRRTELIWITTGSLTLVTILILLLYRQHAQRNADREHAENLRQIAELKLQSLRAQLNPHFMFNSLNAIQEMILRQENEKSHIYLSQFSHLLRMLLENADAPLIPLSKELEFLQVYISIERLRLPDLNYTIHLEPGISPQEVMVPNMMLQPYVENAIWHGLSYKPHGERSIVLRVRREGEKMFYEIEDNGIGRKRADEIKNSIRKNHKSRGMELLNKRFALLKVQYDLEIDTQVDDILRDELVAGTRVAIVTPVSFTPMFTIFRA